MPGDGVASGSRDLDHRDERHRFALEPLVRGVERKWLLQSAVAIEREPDLAAGSLAPAPATGTCDLDLSRDRTRVTDPRISMHDIIQRKESRARHFPLLPYK